MKAMNPLKHMTAHDEKNLSEYITLEVDWLELLGQIQELFMPEQIFAENDLREWAVSNGYVLAQEPNETEVRY